MTTRFDALTRPKAGTDHRAVSKHRSVGFGLAFVGLMLAVVTLIANIAAANEDSAETARETLAWSFGLTTLAFGTIKLAIAIILVGILVRLWLRVTAVSESLPGLKAQADAPSPRGDVDTNWGRATETADVPAPLPVHR
ncbi:MAG: hypothetical protein ACE5GC_00805, partial [Acidimicrobiia bacterium]